jgi:hypothetical protein
MTSQGFIQRGTMGINPTHNIHKGGYPTFSLLGNAFENGENAQIMHFLGF